MKKIFYTLTALMSIGIASAQVNSMSPGTPADMDSGRQKNSLTQERPQQVNTPGVPNNPNSSSVSASVPSVAAPAVTTSTAVSNGDAAPAAQNNAQATQKAAAPAATTGKP